MSKQSKIDNAVEKVRARHEREEKQRQAAAEITKADTFISQADVKAVIRDKAILAMVIPEPTDVIGYEVNVVKRT